MNRRFFIKCSSVAGSIFILPGLSLFSPDHLSLPKILIIGDSISIGYTPFVKQMLGGIAGVHHNPGNGRYTGFGLEKLEEWLGDKSWDVIH